MKAGGRASPKLCALRGPGAGRLFPVLVHGGRTKELLENFLGGSYINVFLPSVHYSPPGRRPRRGGGAGPLGPDSALALAPLRLLVGLGRRYGRARLRRPGRSGVY